MPSLRRTTSTPLVRPSPYPTSLSLSAGSAQNAAAAQRPRRVGSATENGRRRVLADIDWWIVMDGQQDQTVDTAAEPEQERDQAQDVNSTLAGIEGLAPALDIVVPSISDVLRDRASDGSLEALALSVPFAALSLASVGPVTPPRSRHGHARQDSAGSSDSSVTSTPESSPFAFTDAFSDAHFVSNMVPTASDCCVTFPPLLNTRQNALSAVTVASGISRSVSFGGFASAHWADDRFGDMAF